MKETFIVDLFYKKIYGPYKNKRKLEKVEKLVKIFSDMFLEFTTNILIIDDENLKNFKSKETFILSDIEELRKGVQNAVYKTRV